MYFSTMTLISHLQQLPAYLMNLLNRSWLQEGSSPSFNHWHLAFHHISDFHFQFTLLCLWFFDRYAYSLHLVNVILCLTSDFCTICFEFRKKNNNNFITLSKNHHIFTSFNLTLQQKRFQDFLNSMDLILNLIQGHSTSLFLKKEAVGFNH